MSLKNNEIDTLELVRNEFNKLVNEQIETHKYNDVLEKIKTLGFGEIKTLYESISDEILDTDNGVKLMRKYVKTIKENKDLRQVFAFYDFINKLNVDSNNRSTYINESLKCLKDIDKANYKRGVKKLGEIVSEAVKLSSLNREIIEENINNTNKLFESVEYIALEKLSLKNISDYVNAENNILEFLEKKGTIVTESCDDQRTNKELLDEINNELTEVNESWAKDLIEDITLNNISNKGNEELFENYKNDCLMIIEGIINNNDDIEDKSKMYSLKEKLSNKVYCNESFNEDIINLAELKNILKYEN